MRYYSSFSCTYYSYLRTSIEFDSVGYMSDQFLLWYLEVWTQLISYFSLLTQARRADFYCFQWLYFQRWQRHSMQLLLLHLSKGLESCFSAIIWLNSFWKKQFTYSNFELFYQSFEMQASMRLRGLGLSKGLISECIVDKYQRIYYFYWRVNLLKTKLFFFQGLGRGGTLFQLCSSG